MGASAWPLPSKGIFCSDAEKPDICPLNVAAHFLQEEPAGKQRSVNVHVEETNALINRCLQGDGHAWRQIVESHHRRVYSLCYRFTGSSGDAEDLTQEVFLKVYRNLKAFAQERGTFQSWLTTLTRNLLVDHFRRTKLEHSTDSLDAGWEQPDSAPSLIDSLQGKEATPLEYSIQRELQGMVQKALLKVSPELREAVILRDLKDMDYKEIAEVLRIPEGTVKSRISRGRMELARLLERTRKQVMQ